MDDRVSSPDEILAEVGRVLGMWLMFRGQQPAAWNRDAPYWITGAGIGVANTTAGLLLRTRRSWLSSG